MEGGVNKKKIGLSKLKRSIYGFLKIFDIIDIKIENYTLRCIKSASHKAFRLMT